MNIQQAILSRKPFKTPTMNDYIYVGSDGFFHWLSDELPLTTFPASLILSDKWEVIKESVIIEFPKKSNIPPTSPEAS